MTNNIIFDRQILIYPLSSLSSPNNAYSEAILDAQIITGIDDDASGITGLSSFIATNEEEDCRQFQQFCGEMKYSQQGIRAKKIFFLLHLLAADDNIGSM